MFGEDADAAGAHAQLILDSLLCPLRENLPLANNGTAKFEMDKNPMQHLHTIGYINEFAKRNADGQQNKDVAEKALAAVIKNRDNSVKQQIAATIKQIDGKDVKAPKLQEYMASDQKSALIDQFKVLENKQRWQIFVQGKHYNDSTKKLIQNSYEEDTEGIAFLGTFAKTATPKQFLQMLANNYRLMGKDQHAKFYRCDDSWGDAYGLIADLQENDTDTVLSDGNILRNLGKDFDTTDNDRQVSGKEYTFWGTWDQIFAANAKANSDMLIPATYSMQNAPTMKSTIASLLRWTTKFTLPAWLKDVPNTGTDEANTVKVSPDKDKGIVETLGVALGDKIKPDETNNQDIISSNAVTLQKLDEVVKIDDSTKAAEKKQNNDRLAKKVTIADSDKESSAKKDDKKADDKSSTDKKDGKGKGQKWSGTKKAVAGGAAIAVVGVSGVAAYGIYQSYREE